jgi:16S rRNA (guanine527-N7)-methyltransferase
VSADHILDVGAGGGLPALPLALACPERHFTLLDTNSKKTRFLTQCVLELKLANVTVVQERAERFAPKAPFRQITSRAFTALANLIDWCDHLLADDGEFLAMKGQYPHDEVRALPSDWQIARDAALQVPGCEGTRHLLIINRVSSRSESHV